jgi:Ca2+-binding EF-hand superfamily protein
MCDKMSPEQAEKLKVELKAAFDSFDKDKSGNIDCKEFESVLTQFNASSECKKKIEPEKIKTLAAQFIQAADKNADGKVNFGEFHKFLIDALGGCKK